MKTMHPNCIRSYTQPIITTLQLYSYIASYGFNLYSFAIAQLSSQYSQLHYLASYCGWTQQPCMQLMHCHAETTISQLICFLTRTCTLQYIQLAILRYSQLLTIISYVASKQPSHTHRQLHACTLTHTRTHTHSHTHNTHTYTHIHTHTYTHTYTHIHTHTQTNTHTYTHSHAHTHTHTMWCELNTQVR